MEPVRTSTPKLGVNKIIGRKSIHDPPCPSPINTMEKPFDLKNKENVESEIDENESDDEQQKEIEDGEEENLCDEEESVKSPSRMSVEKKLDEKEINYKHFFKNVNISVIVGVLILIIILVLYPINQETKRDDGKMEITNLKRFYPHQNPNLWYYITSNIKDVLRYNKPSVILFLYLKNQEKTTNELILTISRIAQKNLNENALEPLIINGLELNTNSYLKDYGYLIEDYKPILEERNVLAVKNLELVSSNVSQAFHYLCDEFNPLVRKSFIVFTVKVEKFIGKEFDQAGIVLRNVWRDLEDDKLEALITRVTNLVLRINPE
ncbi:uncharacterized protein TORI [Onthophagus taurus]|uniref:uncharacterized protein TORI n=1 Tax=Onthophagus taurus TaxID=166361 RepID=UPI0039BDF538